ncbi:MAG: response regulator [Anaerolineaceae bacterium]|nr:response regulator [Anaerolineaceae bacterium]
MRIAYVEDNAANLALLGRICNMNQDELITYRNPLDAFSQINEAPVDLIIIDMHLGDDQIDGLELTRKLRDNGVAVPIIAITSYDNIYASRYADAGCDDYIQKPVAIQDMVNLINEYRR